ncbi:hypothetical protein EIP91_007833 [Steccherinum ochraceum]|uniref:RecA family profile 1 domain-containing protein n=1 Tax=Steccherinum ochraceum TaxID=92696 RepID=A0A4R0R6D4_9APHY|nr:hypothetical protein EIP91_007833 [Steccherinum ochraceum]
MRLRTIGHPLSAELIDALDLLNIKTDSDLIFSGTPTEIWLKLPPDTIRLQEEIDVVEAVLARVSAPGRTGLDELDLEKRRHEELSKVEMSSGVQKLDALIGGFGHQRVLEVSGDRGSGKTALALQIVLRQLSQSPNSSAVWIDTTGDASPDRISAMLSSLPENEGALTVLQRLQITRAFDLDALREALEEVQLMTNVGVEQPTVRTVVIDTITPIFRPLLSAVTSQGHASMATFMQQLRSLAEESSITFIVLNGTSASAPNNPSSVFASTDRKPGLGPSFTYMTDATLWLAKWTKDLGYDLPEESVEQRGE